MNKVITYEETLAYLNELVESKPEGYVYEHPKQELDDGALVDTSICFYHDPLTGEPSCIVGHVAKKLSPELYDVMVQDEIDTFESDSFKAYKDQAKRFYDQKSIVLLTKAQEYQDIGITWAESVSKAEVKANNVLT